MRYANVRVDLSSHALEIKKGAYNFLNSKGARSVNSLFTYPHDSTELCLAKQLFCCMIFHNALVAMVFEALSSRVRCKLYMYPVFVEGEVVAGVEIAFGFRVLPQFSCTRCIGGYH